MTDTEKLNQILERLARIESRLCKLMLHMNISPQDRVLHGTFIDLLKEESNES